MTTHLHLEQRKLEAISSAEGAEGADAPDVPAATRLPAPATAAEVNAQLAAISTEIDGYISLPSEAKLPAPLLAAAFKEYEGYAGRPPADEHEALNLLQKVIEDARQVVSKQASKQAGCKQARKQAVSNA